MVNSLFALAWLLRSQGEYNRARVLCEESLAWAVPGLARVALALSDYVAARSRYEESLARARAIDHQELLVTCVAGLAMVVSAQ